jgi:hypothetical protein
MKTAFVAFAEPDVDAEPWADPDHPDPKLDAAYRGGIVPPAQRWRSDFIMPIAPAGPRKRQPDDDGGQ